MDNHTLAQTLHRIAKRDVNQSNIGRLILPELKHETTENLTAQTIMALWQQFYPEETADHRTENIILIYFDGKDTTKNIRNTQTPTNLQQNVYTAEPEREVFQPETYSNPEEYYAEKPEDNIIM